MKKIRLANMYRRAGGIIIPAGEYEITHKDLKGLGQYLVDNGHATVIAGADAPEPVLDIEPVTGQGPEGDPESEPEVSSSEGETGPEAAITWDPSPAAIAMMEKEKVTPDQVKPEGGNITVNDVREYVASRDSVE